MKRTVALILALLMILTLAACGAKKDEEVKYGVLEIGSSRITHTAEHKAQMDKEFAINDDAMVERVNYNNLSTALLDLENGTIRTLGLEECVADYVAAHNEKIVVTKNNRVTDFSMMTMDSNKEVYDILNNAIVELKADGTLDELIEKELKAYINTDPEAKELPHFDGAKTIKVAVTGDLPPMDFVTAYGKAAGFNIALLTEIANRAQVNFELVQIETGARPVALSTGKVDAVFWTKIGRCTVCNATVTEGIQGTLVTESYFSSSAGHVMIESGK